MSNSFSRDQLGRRALGIVRVSTRKQDRGHSPVVQETGIREYARDVGLELVAIETIHESGKDSRQRPLFNAALDKARTKNAPHLVFWVWDRIGRNFTDFERLENDVNDGRIAIHNAFERREVNASTPSNDWMGLEVMGLTAKQYSRDLRRRAIESMAAKAEQGWYPTKAPLGYRNVKRTGQDGQVLDRGGHIELQPWGRHLIRRMYSLRLDGLSLNAIAEAIAVEDLGVPGRHLRGFRKSGRQKKVEKILKDPFYMGEFMWSGERYPGKHEPVLSRSEWTRLQATFDGKHAPHRAKRKNAPLVGFLVCGECGCRVSYDPKTKNGRTYEYYRCANGRRAHGRLKYVSEAAIFAGLEPAVDAISIDADLATRIAEELTRTHERVRRQRRQEVAKAEAAMEGFEEREDRLVDLLAAGTLDHEAFKRQLGRLREEQRRRREQLAQTQERLDDNYLFTAQRILELAQQARTLWKTRSGREKRQLLEELVSNPTLTGATVGYDLKKPFAVLAEMRESKEWHARVQEFRTAVVEASRAA